MFVLSNSQCRQCRGVGLKANQRCTCVLRRIFAACHRQWRYLTRRSGAHPTRVTLGKTGGPINRVRMFENHFAVDFEIIARRTLSQADYQLFRWVYLLGADWKLLRRTLKTGMTESEFRHHCAWVEETLAHAFCETRPYALWPMDEYNSRRKPGAPPVAALPAIPGQRYAPLRPPLRRGLMMARSIRPKIY